MGILVKADTRVLCFAPPGPDDQACSHCLERARDAGTQVVGMVRPGEDAARPAPCPLYPTAVQAVRDTGANAALIHVQPGIATDAMMEAIDAGLPLIVCRTHGVPARDMVKVINYLQSSSDLSGPRHNEGRIWLLGPGSSGVIAPGTGMVGTFEPRLFRPGPVAIVSRSNCLAETAAQLLEQHHIGQSTCLVTSSALIVPTRLADVLGMLEADPDTEVIVMIGGVGGYAELEAADFVKEAVTKPIIAYLPGRSAPPGIDLGANGDCASAGTAEIAHKAAALRDAGVLVVPHIEDIVPAVADRL